MMMASNRHGSRMVYALGVCAAVLVAAFSGGAFAAEKKDVMFRGVKIKPQVGTYIVLKDVRIRSAPKTKSKKVGLFKAGSRIHVVGRAAFAWVAVRENGKDVGFVYDQVLLPLIDGTLENELTGKAASGVKGGATSRAKARSRAISSRSPITMSCGTAGRGPARSNSARPCSSPRRPIKWG